MKNMLTKLVLWTILAMALFALTNGTPLPKYLTEDDEIMAEGLNELDLQIATELNKPRYKTNPLKVQLDWIRSKLIKYSDDKAKLAKLLDITMASLNDTQQEYNGLMNENYRRDPRIQQDVYFYGQLLKSYKNIARGIYNQKSSIYDGPTIRFEPRIFYVVFAFALYFLAIWVVYKYGGYLYGQCCRPRAQQRAASRRNQDDEDDARNLLQENSPRSRSPIRPVFCLATPDSNSPRHEAQAEVHVEELEMSPIGPDQDEELVESPISPLSADDFHPLKADCVVELFPEDSPKQEGSSVENVEPAPVQVEETEIQIQGDPIDV